MKRDGLRSLSSNGHVYRQPGGMSWPSSSGNGDEKSPGKKKSGKKQ
jgi:hypothetical protein